MKNKLFKSILVIILLYTTSLISEEVSNPLSKDKNIASSEEIRKLIVLIGAQKIGEQIIKYMIPNLKIQNPSISTDFWIKIEKEFSSNRLVNLIIPIYKKHFTKKDIKEITAFYMTPIGQKFIRVRPEIVKESMLIGRQWGLEIFTRIREKINQIKK